MAVIFRAITAGGCVSRSDLVTRTGLSRKTVGAVIGELVARGLVDESGPVTRGVGRPSHSVRPSRSLAALVVRLGADVVHVAVVGLDGVPQKESRCPLERSHGVDEVAGIVAAVAEGMAEPGARALLGVGVVAEGPREPSGPVEPALTAALQCRLGVPAFSTSDGIAGTLAANRFGVGAGFRDMIYVRDGEGGAAIGGAFVNGALVRGHRGLAGRYGELGSERISATTFSGSGSGPGPGPTPVPASDTGAQIAAILAPLCQVLDPALIVLGGVYAPLATSVQDHLRAGSTRAIDAPPTVVGSALRNELLVGGAQWVFDQTLAEPHRFLARVASSARAS